MSLLDNAKTLRRNLTDAKQKLWYHLRAHRFMGRKFKRQNLWADMWWTLICMEEKLIIELDGGQHAENQKCDQERDAWLRGQGYTVLRFWNNELMNETEGVLERIRFALSKEADSSETLSPGSSPVNGRGEKL